MERGNPMEKLFAITATSISKSPPKAMSSYLIAGQVVCHQGRYVLLWMKQIISGITPGFPVLIL